MAAYDKPMSIEEQRLLMAQGEADGLEHLGPCPPHLVEAWIDVPLSDNRTNRTKVVWPKSTGNLSQCPLVIYFHGGGLSVASPDLVLAPARGLATLLSCVVACPTLNQLPEQPFPAPVRMAWETCAWLSDAGNLNDGILKDAGAQVDLRRGFVVGGLSSGGATAAVIGTIPGAASAGVKEFSGLAELKSPITGIFVGIPFLVTEAMLPPQYRDMLKSRDEIIENKEALRTMRLDLESRLDTHSPWFSPLNLDLSSPDITQGYPPKVFIYGGQLDQFRDDSIIYAKWLSQVPGVEVRVTVLEGEGHNAWISALWPACQTRPLKEIVINGMAWLLNVEWDDTQELLL